ncbi:MAG: nicotinamide riboside transporter PnuC [Opitutaceae bacterium]|nr:nicotinamide riboside transporter PnuC [Opitutaceae bacterium]
MNVWEIAGTVLGVLGVALTIRQSLWCWPVGIVQVLIYAWVFYTAKLYSDVILQFVFFVLQAYGWWHWLRGGTGHAALPVSRLSSQGLAGWVAVGAGLTAAWGLFMHRTTDAALPYWDAFILVFSLIAQWLQARKNLECWAGWMIVNVVAIGVYWAKGLQLTSGLYGIFLLMAAAGWYEWQRSILRRVAVFGPESTGKTRLAEKLAAHFGTVLVPEYSRRFWDEHGGITAADIPGIAHRQWALEEAGAAEARRVLICDTDSLTTVLWSDLLYGGCDADIRAGADQRARHYDLYLLLDVDVPFAPDPARCFPKDEDRQRCMRLWREALERRGLPFVVVRGDWAQREAQAIAAVEALLKKTG